MLSFSNIKVPVSSSGTTSAYGGIFDRPTKAADPFTATNALAAKKTSTITAPKNMLSSSTPTQSPSYSYTAPSTAGGLSQSQVIANLQNFYNSNPSAAKPTTAVGTTPTYRMDNGKVVPIIPAENNGGVNPTGSYTPTGSSVQNPTGTTAPSQNTGLYGQLIGSGVDTLNEAGKVQKEAGLLRQAMQRQTRDVYGNPYYSGTVKVGQAANIAQQQGAQLEGLAAEEKALTTRGQAFMSGAGLAAPVQVPYGTQYVSPVTGESALGASSPSGAGGQQNPQNQAALYANEVASGRRSYADAVSAMGLYGGVGKQFLDQAIRTANPNFNFAQAQTLGAQQGAIEPAYNYATQAISTVENALAKVNSLQSSNIPLVNKLGDAFSFATGVGSQESRELVGAVQTLRNAYASLLASTRGGTPTDYSSQALAEIPDRPTPNDIAAIKANMQTLGQARVGINGNPGSGSAPTIPNASNLFDW